MTKLTVVERTILANQYRILAQLDNEREDEFGYAPNGFMAEALERGYEGFYDEVLVGERIISEQVKTETWHVMKMFVVIQNSVNRLTPEQKKTIGEENIEAISFQGFNSNINHDDHYLMLEMFMKKGWFTEYMDRAHSGTKMSIDNYSSLLRKFIDSPDYDIILTPEQIQQLIDVVLPK